MPGTVLLALPAPSTALSARTTGSAVRYRELLTSTKEQSCFLSIAYPMKAITRVVTVAGNRKELISWESSLHKRDLKYQIETFMAKPFAKRRS